MTDRLVLLLIVVRGGAGGVADLRGGGNRDGLKRDAVADVVQNNLPKKTPLQKTFSGNFLALFGGRTAPVRFTLRAHRCR